MDQISYNLNTDGNVTAWYNAESLHSAAISLLHLDVAWMRSHIGDFNIRVTNAPLERGDKNKKYDSFLGLIS